jgi:hypothetical protein
MAVDMPQVPGNLPAIAVLLDGKRRIAVLDTQLPIIILSRPMSDFTMGRPADISRATSFIDVAFFPFTRRFASLRVGFDTLRNVKVLVTATTRLNPLPHIQLGGSYLSDHRVILSMPDRRAYIPLPVGAIPASTMSPPTTASEN